MTPDPDEQEDRPWKERLPAYERPRDLEKAEERIRVLSEVQAHREWVIDGLRKHIVNLESDRDRLEQRTARLETHARNLEERIAELSSRAEELSSHAGNLERVLAERGNRLAELERHVLNLEKRIPLHRARLGRSSILPETGPASVARAFRAGNRLWENRADLQSRFPRDHAPDFWYWLMWHGGATTADLGASLPPVPPPHLMSRVVGHGNTPEAYRRGGLVDWWRIEDGLRGAGFDPARGGRLLDFGVGCGRILQGFSLYANQCEITGVDVDGEAIAWCQGHLDFARFATLPLEPPSSLPTASFEAIYAFSVFSHLPEELHRRWLEELARLAAPGGALAITVQGRHVVDMLVSGRNGEHPFVAKQLRKQRKGLEERGFLFVPYRSLAFEDVRNARFFEGWDLDRYGDTFILEHYVREHWSDLFEIVAYHEAPDDWQDLVVLRRR